MKKSTGELLEILKRSSLEAYLKENGGELIADSPLCDYLNALLDEKGLTKADIIRRTSISAPHVYQTFSGERIPTRDKLIALCFGMNLTVDETQTLLKYTGYAPLYPRSTRDSVIIAAIKNGESVIRCNITLDELNLSPL